MKNGTAREKLQKSVRESRFLYVKKLEKIPKNSFTHTFDFHVGKKKTLAGRKTAKNSDGHKRPLTEEQIEEIF